LWLLVDAARYGIYIFSGVAILESVAMTLILLYLAMRTLERSPPRKQDVSATMIGGLALLLLVSIAYVVALRNGVEDRMVEPQTYLAQTLIRLCAIALLGWSAVHL